MNAINEGNGSFQKLAVVVARESTVVGLFCSAVGGIHNNEGSYHRSRVKKRNYESYQ